MIKQRLMGVERYPLVLMLEPLFRCNLACPGCGKIDYPSTILDQRLSLEDCLAAVDECGAPVVSIPGGEPLIHPEMKDIVAGIVGGLLGGWLLSAFLDVEGGGIIFSFLTCLLGAVILLWIVKMVMGRSKV